MTRRESANVSRKSNGLWGTPMLGDVLVANDRLQREAVETRKLLNGVAADAARPFAVAVLDWNHAVLEAATNEYQEEPLSEAGARAAGAALAGRVHVEAVSALHDGSTGAGGVVDVERELRNTLAALRSAVMTGEVRLVNSGLSHLGRVLHPTLLNAARAVDPATTDVAEGLDVVQTSQLARRVAAVTAGAVELQRRMLSTRLQSSTAGVAQRRSILLDRTGIDVVDLRTNLDGLEEGIRTGLLAFVTGSSWIDRPSRPYTRIDLAAGGELRVHFKNARLVGVAADQWLWGRCKGEAPTDDGTNYAVAEFEGPTGDAREIWENWLQVEARSAYDIAPASIHAHAAFAPPGTSAAVLDLTSRLDTKVVA